MFPIHATMPEHNGPKTTHTPILIWAFLVVDGDIKAVIERVEDHSFQQADLYEIFRTPTTKGL